MNRRDQIVQELIKDKYFHKWIIDPDQKSNDFWTNWAKENPEKNECVRRARSILLSFKFQPGPIPPVKKDLLWDTITKQIEETYLIRKRQRKNNINFLRYGIPAAIALLIMVAFAYNNGWINPSKTKKTSVSIVEKTAPKGKISSFEFEDGSMVKLFSDSKIRFPEKFDKGLREVYLEGEGFFEVKKDAKRPFIVKTKNLATTALGTSFNIRTYKRGNDCDVSLVTGRVKVERLDKASDGPHQVILTPGEEAVLKNNEVVKRPFNIDETVAWKDGYIYLENKSFDETLQILDRWFDVDFEVRNRGKAKGKKGTGRFKNQNLENILQVIGYSFSFSFEINDDKVTITL